MLGVCIYLPTMVYSRSMGGFMAYYYLIKMKTMYVGIVRWTVYAHLKLVTFARNLMS